MSSTVIVDAQLCELLERAQEFKAKGWRFVQCCATRNSETQTELLYSFCDDATNEMTNLRLLISDGDEVPSVGALFPTSFMFENEMHDLFGIKVNGMVLDYRGGFYHLHIPAPMTRVEAKPAKPAAARKAAEEKE